MNYNELKRMTQTAQRTNDASDWMALELAMRDLFTEMQALTVELAMFRVAAAMKEWQR